MSIEPAQGLDQLKRSLRKRCSAVRDGLAPEFRIAAAARVADFGIAFASLPRGALVSAYMAMGSELDPLPLLQRIVAEGYRTCLPVVTPLGNPLVFRAWSPGEKLVARTWGIREPVEEARQVEPDALLVPLLAFDRRGVRLGYGGGYYDRTLEKLRAIKPLVAIGTGFAEQELDEVPCGPHDQRLDWVLTPDGSFRI